MIYLQTPDGFERSAPFPGAWSDARTSQPAAEEPRARGHGHKERGAVEAASDSNAAKYQWRKKVHETTLPGENVTRCTFLRACRRPTTPPCTRPEKCNRSKRSLWHAAPADSKSRSTRRCGLCDERKNLPSFKSRSPSPPHKWQMDIPLADSDRTTRSPLLITIQRTCFLTRRTRQRDDAQTRPHISLLRIRARYKIQTKTAGAVGSRCKL